ncbi:ABC efflux pump, inner membrane subunit [Candidatus Koribacter versatilis Ellin345]|uniref:ABC efflux pump, inner membrane subunit n=1 Tax=Koribacter versatilis (strain Ellin345) TaxID=204669 RepID=Q1IHX2_KORVE|nr:ABC transporter permease [Candidatus Koribacter versatilis]ABF43528.1 ABC efflux pump, inner membrane subunit [Candidatus Koribacter versatilis Ellin345]
MISFRDLRYAWRQLRRSPGFAIVAILTLALGIGANTAIFSAVDSVLLRPLPFPHPETLVALQADTPYPKGWVREYQRQGSGFAFVSGYSLNQEYNLAGTNASDRTYGSTVSVNFFDTLSVQPLLGRFFSPEEERSGQDRVVVLSYAFWRSHFGANPSIVGSTVHVDGIPRQVLGVAPKNVRFPDNDTQIWLPISFDDSKQNDPWATFFNLRAIGRLKPGVTANAAQAQLRTIHPQMLALFPWRMPDKWAADISVRPLLDSIVGESAPKFYLLLGAVGLVLLIASANVANLLLARAASRQREIAIRSALGASIPRLVRQLLTESLLLSVFAGVVGVLLAWAGLRILKIILPPETPRLADISLHPGVLMFAAAVSLLTGILAGLVPAWNSASDVQEKLRSNANNVFGTAKRFSISRMLVIGQVAIVVVVILAAGVMLRSLYRLASVNPGFEVQHVVGVQVSLDRKACDIRGNCANFFHNLLERAQALPGIEKAAIVDTLPMGGDDLWYVFDAENHPREARQPANVSAGRIASDGYFRLMGISLLQGRYFDQSDASGSSRAVIVNAAMASHFWPGQNPIGKRIVHTDNESSPGVIDPETASVIVGVVSDTRHERLDRDSGWEVYLPLAPNREFSTMNLVVRSSTNVSGVAGSVRQLVTEIDPTATVAHVRTLDEVLTASTANSRSLTFLLVAFAALGAAVGGMGIYSLIAYTVSWRTREIGLRLALGANKRQVAILVLKQSLALSLTGSAVGVSAAYLCRNLMRSFLFQTSPTDLLTFVAVPLMVGVVALVASWVPARRAMRIDPMQALRFE